MREIDTPSASGLMAAAAGACGWRGSAAGAAWAPAPTPRREARARSSRRVRPRGVAWRLDGRSPPLVCIVASALPDGGRLDPRPLSWRLRCALHSHAGSSLRRWPCRSRRWPPTTAGPGYQQRGIRDRGQRHRGRDLQRRARGDEDQGQRPGVGHHAGAAGGDLAGRPEGRHDPGRRHRGRRTATGTSIPSGSRSRPNGSPTTARRSTSIPIERRAARQSSAARQSDARRS